VADTDKVRLVVLGDAALIIVRGNAEGSGEHLRIQQVAADQGFIVLEDEYFDRELDGYVYVMTSEDGIGE
jgi:hypothetical protein